mmetsp:Transcript_92281/g.214395  ORF Transcript_92281/g.214395 Transcript_92281/m.214395 type:complete len:231 (+) Transcript_92281:695-1387(+)
MAGGAGAPATGRLADPWTEPAGAQGPKVTDSSRHLMSARSLSKLSCRSHSSSGKSLSFLPTCTGTLPFLLSCAGTISFSALPKSKPRCFSRVRSASKTLSKLPGCSHSSKVSCCNTAASSCSSSDASHSCTSGGPSANVTLRNCACDATSAKSSESLALATLLPQDTGDTVSAQLSSSSVHPLASAANDSSSNFFASIWRRSEAITLCSDASKASREAMSLATLALSAPA